jgi:hypothetical protein
MRVTELIASPDNRGVAGVRFEDTRGTPRSLAADLIFVLPKVPVRERSRRPCRTPITGGGTSASPGFSRP